MALIWIVEILLLTYGMYQLGTGVMHVPRKKTSKAVMEYINKDSRKTIDMYLLDFAGIISGYIPLMPMKRDKLDSQLASAGIHMTAETYTAFAYVKAAFYIVIGCPFLLIPIFGLIPFVLFVLNGLNAYFVESSRVDVLLRQRKTAVEKELPRLANTIKQELRHTRDVVRILENYAKNAGKTMRKELNITVADMKSGNYEMALTRLETRIQSVTLSQIVRGLVSVLRGDDGIFYFEMLAHDLRKLETQQLKMEAIKQPEKIGKYTMYIFLCFLLIIFATLALAMTGQMKTII